MKIKTKIHANSDWSEKEIKDYLGMLFFFVDTVSTNLGLDIHTSLQVGYEVQTGIKRDKLNVWCSSIDKNNNFCSPDEDPMPPLATITCGNQTLHFYEFAMVAFIEDKKYLGWSRFD